MTWVRKDDQMPINRKIATLSDAAYRLDDEAICWASRNGTNGVISVDEFGTISPRATKKNADELVKRRRWHRAEDPACTSENCAPAGPDGYVIHDYLDYNPSAEQVLDDRRRKAARQRTWRASRRSTDPPTGASTNGERDASRDALVDPAPRARVSRPVPSTPSPSSSTSPLAALGLDEREIQKTEEAITLAMPHTRSLPAVTRTLIANGDIHAYIDQARTHIAQDQPRISGPDHPWTPDKYGAACTQCPLPKERHQEATA